jgi:hypothetical protein
MTIIGHDKDCKSLTNVLTSEGQNLVKWAYINKTRIPATKFFFVASSLLLQNQVAVVALAG